MIESANIPDLLPIIRTRLAARVQGYGLRAVAREVGMSPTGLQEMIAGADPYRKTINKLLNWFARQGSDDLEAAERRAMGVELATRGLPHASRTAELLKRIVENESTGMLEAVERAVAELER